MKEIVYKYKKLIGIWVVVHATILTINLFDIRGGHWPNTLLTDYNKYPSTILWPFVKFAETHITENPYGVPLEKREVFHGIFYGYDFTEFLLYIGLLVVFLTYKVVMVKEQPTKS